MDEGTERARRIIGYCWAPMLAIGAATLLVMLPALMLPPMTGDSHWITIAWADRFFTELAAGDPYPRWLSQSHGGLGAPTFYFYPPLAFYVTAAFQALGLTVYPAVLAAYALGTAASGAAMYVWLKDIGRHALPGAVLYMLLPYHLTDFYYRGALAEFMAYVWLPLIALGMRRVGERSGIAVFATAYAALICTHLPSALIASVLLIAPFALYLAWHDRAKAIPIAGGIMLGIGLSGVYLVPALALQPHAAMRYLWGLDYYQVATWSFFAVPWPSAIMFQVIVPVTIAIAAIAILLLLRGQRFAAYPLALAALIAGLVPGFWSLPPIDRVQFPWRALSLAEFAIVTALAATAITRRDLILLASPLLLLSLVPVMMPAQDDYFTVENIRTRQPEVREYLPREVPSQPEMVSNWAIRLAERMRRELPADATMPAFEFPAWRVRCGAETLVPVAHPATRLIAAPDGCRLYLVTLREEWTGGLLTLLCALLLIGVTVRRRPRAAR